ncbi:MAG: enoyl-CoA hydratase/isomerase family protein [Rhodospirillales bacterium]|nr:enoyl-CoA hydratase/isomerase family protein [Rhodospirillales bacterium]
MCVFQLSQHGGIKTVTMDAPPVNAINAEWVTRFGEILDQLNLDEDTGVVLIRSAHKVFCAGADLKQFQKKLNEANSADALSDDARRYQVLFRRLETLRQVTIAEIGGAALGGGFELALACDLRIAADEAKLGLPEGRLGLVPGAGGTQRLTRLAGPGVAARIILGAEIVDGRTAQGLGMVQFSVPRDQLPGEAAKLADSIDALSRPALVAAKKCIAAAIDPARDGFEEEVRATSALIDTGDARGRVAAFLEI